jgi:hypothetical protein
MPGIPSFSPTTNYGRLLTLAYPTVTITPNAVAAAVTHTTAELLAGVINRDTLSSARADLFPTAALIVAAINGCMVGTSFRVVVRNVSAGAGSITHTTNTGLTLTGTVVIPFQSTKEYMFIVTNVTPGSEAVTVLSLGVAVAI